MKPILKVVSTNNPLGGHGVAFTAVIDMVKARLREAGGTLKRMKIERWDLPQQRMAWWPDVIHSSSDAYGYEPTKTKPAAPPPGAIDRMEEVLGWLLWLDDDARMVIWARASKITWRQMEMRDGRSRETLRKMHDKALAVIVEHLTRKP